MKTKLFILILFCFGALISSAQSTPVAVADKCPATENWKTQRWAIGVNVNTVEPITDAGFDFNEFSVRTFSNGNEKDESYCIGLNIAYKIKENCALRLSARMTNYKVTETVDFRAFSPSPSDYGLNSSDIKQSMFAISPGILWNSNYKKLNYYGGFQLVYRQYSSVIGNTDYRDYLFANNALISVQNYYQTEPGGYSIGLGPVVGFSVNVFKYLSIGAEFSTAYSYYKTGGAITTAKTNIFPASVAGPPSINISALRFQGFKFSSILSTINVAFNF